MLVRTDDSGWYRLPRYVPIRENSVRLLVHVSASTITTESLSVGSTIGYSEIFIEFRIYQIDLYKK